MAHKNNITQLIANMLRSSVFMTCLWDEGDSMYLTSLMYLALHSFISCPLCAERAATVDFLRFAQLYF